MKQLNIPRSRLLLYFMILGLIPIIFSISYFFTKQRQINQLEDTLYHVEGAALSKERKQSANKAVIHHFRDADHFYIDKHLESLKFLEPEIATLQKVADNPNFAGDDSILKRLEYLKSSKNRMLFSEGSVVNYPQFQENIGTLSHPIQMNLDDLQKVLARIEGVTIGSHVPMPDRPQIIILDFVLDKKQVADKNEVFELSMKILKREYL